MPTSGSPTVRRRRLAAELRRLRASTGKTAEDIGKVLGWSKAKISRYELAQGGLKPDDVARLLEFYGVQGSHRDQLLALAEEATHKGWWEAYSDVLTEGHLAFIGLEAEATSILEWQINVVPWAATDRAVRARGAVWLPRGGDDLAQSNPAAPGDPPHPPAAADP